MLLVLSPSSCFPWLAPPLIPSTPCVDGVFLQIKWGSLPSSLGELVQASLEEWELTTMEVFVHLEHSKVPTLPLPQLLDLF